MAAIQLQYRLNAGAWQTTAGTVDSTHVGDTCELGVVDASGVTEWRWEITDFPPGYGTTAPAGWTYDSDTGVFYDTDSTPDSFTLDYWGKYTFRVVVDGGTKRDADGSVIADADKIDERNGVSVSSPQTLRDLAAAEQGQWDSMRAWAGDHKWNLRVIETILGTGGTGLKTKVTAKAALQSNVVLTGEQTLDNVALVDGDIFHAGDQTDPIENGPWVVHVGAWTRHADFPNGGDASGALVGVATGGTNFGGTLWFCSNVSGSDVIGTDGLIWELPEVGQLPVGLTNSVYTSNGVTNAWDASPTVESLLVTGVSGYLAVGTTAATVGAMRLTKEGYLVSGSDLGDLYLIGVDSDDNIPVGDNNARLDLYGTSVIMRADYLGLGNATLPMAGRLRLVNNEFVESITSGGVDAPLIGIDASDIVTIGNTLTEAALLSSGAVAVTADEITLVPSSGGAGDIAIAPITCAAQSPGSLYIRGQSSSHPTGNAGAIFLEGGTGASGVSAGVNVGWGTSVREATSLVGMNYPNTVATTTVFAEDAMPAWEGTECWGSSNAYYARTYYSGGPQEGAVLKTLCPKFEHDSTITAAGVDDGRIGLFTRHRDLFTTANETVRVDFGFAVAAGARWTPSGGNSVIFSATATVLGITSTGVLIIGGMWQRTATFLYRSTSNAIFQIAQGDLVNLGTGASGITGATIAWYDNAGVGNAGIYLDLTTGTDEDAFWDVEVELKMYHHGGVAG